MSEEENAGVVAVATEEVAQVQESENAQPQKETQESAKKRNDAEYNWAEMREQKRRLEQRVQELEEGFGKFNKTTQPQEEEENYGFKDEDLVEGKHLKEINKKLKRLENELHQKDALLVENRIHIQYPDFKQVVSKENIEFLKENEPDLADSLIDIKDPYKQAVAAYKMLKKFAPPAEEKASIEKKQALENAQKPRSVQAVAKSSSMADLNQFAEMDPKSRQAFLRSKYEEMQRSIKAG